MLEQDQVKFPAQTATLKDGREVTLRFLSTEDVDKLGDFYASIEHAAWRFYCPPVLTREDARKKAARANEATSVILVAVDDAQEIVGYNWYEWKDDSKPSIFGICIRKSYRGARLGRTLMTRLFKVAEQVGPNMMSLTVQKANPRAVTLYIDMGFQMVREQIRKQIGEFAAEPEYYMEREAH